MNPTDFVPGAPLGYWPAFAVYLLLGAAGWAIDRSERPAAWKRRVFPWYFGARLAAFLVLVRVIIGELPWFIWAAAIAWFLVGMERAEFCDPCGRYAERSIFSGPKPCPRCGHRPDQSTRPRAAT